MLLQNHDTDPTETTEWLDSLHAVLELEGPRRARYLLDRLVERGQETGAQVFSQGPASPGVYSRAFLEYRLTEENLINFRRELSPGGGLSSYPHPWLMPNFWEFPSVSMGLSPLTSIYQARFNRYLRD